MMLTYKEARPSVFVASLFYQAGRWRLLDAMHPLSCSKWHAPV